MNLVKIQKNKKEIKISLLVLKTQKSKFLNIFRNDRNDSRWKIYPKENNNLQKIKDWKKYSVVMIKFKQK